MVTVRILPLIFLFVIFSYGFADSPALPKPHQVDNPGMIPFIKPDPRKLPGIVVDDTQAKLVGTWKHSVHTPPFVGNSYIHDKKEAKGKKTATFIPELPKTGFYEVRMSHNSNINHHIDRPQMLGALKDCRIHRDLSVYLFSLSICLQGWSFMSGQ